MGYFELVPPREVGIAPESIRGFLQRVEEEGLELHRFMLLRHGKCAAKVTYAPYGEEDLHPLYSFSKSITATAIGFARQEGLLTLEEKVADIFPEDLPENPSSNLLSCQIHHLLCMSCGQETEIEDHGENWRKSFFAHPFLHAPGTFYKYNTAGTNMLAAIIQKKTGQSVTEYLRPRLFAPLGMGEVFAYRLPDDLHTEHGGGGMKMKLEDMARFSQFMLQDGCWEGKALLPGWYHELAGKKQMDTAGDSEGHVKEWAQGYGYQCWMCSLPSSFRADGAFGQFGLIYPTLDLCVIMNSATEQTQTLIDAVNEVLLPGVGAGEKEQKEEKRPGKDEKEGENEKEGKDEKEGEDEKDDTVFLETRHLPALLSCRNPVFEDILSRRRYEKNPEEEMCSLPRLVGGSGLLAIEEAGPITSLGFGFGEKDVFLTFTQDGEEKKLTLGRGYFAKNEVDGISYAGCVRWRSLRCLEMELRRLDALSGVRLLLRFTGEKLTFQADETLMTDGGLGMTVRPLAVFYTGRGEEESQVARTGNNPGA
ncbi:MAG: serine hydrolase [Blautia sp.]|nr:serine hydrolase [Blautia sp.]